MIVLDTATWIWLSSSPNQLSTAATEAIKEQGGGTVSAISAWEVGMLVAKGRIELDRPVERWVDEAMRAKGVVSAPVDHHVAVLSTLLPADPPADPADRLIVATALRHDAVLVTPDRRLLEYPFCPTLW